MKKIIITIVTILGVFTAALGYMFTVSGSLGDATVWNEQRPPTERENFALMPGTFTGFDDGGFYGDISVSITVDEAGTITRVEVVYSNETPEFADPAFAHLISAVLADQSPDVDIFTGATITSVAFLNAVTDAIRQSERLGVAGRILLGTGEGGYGGDITLAFVIDDYGNIVSVEVVEHSETPMWADMAFGPLITAVLDAQSYDIDIITDATYTSEAFIAAVQDALRQLGGAQEDGTVLIGVDAYGYGGYIIVSVIVDDSGRILDVEVIEHSETPRWAAMAFGPLIDSVLETQSTDIDVITDATYTSLAFIAAVEDALSQFDMGEVTGTVFIGIGSGGYGGDIYVAVTISDDGGIIAVEVVEHSETPGFANRAFGQLIPSVLEAQSANVDVVTDATYTSEAFMSAVQDALNQFAGAAGTVFIGTGAGGYGGDISVAVTISGDGAITAVEVVEHSETPGFANRAFGQLIPSVLEAQSANVDVVTDATYTSEAFIAAIQDALDQTNE